MRPPKRRRLHLQYYTTFGYSTKYNCFNHPELAHTSLALLLFLFICLAIYLLSFFCLFLPIAFLPSCRCCYYIHFIPPFVLQTMMVRIDNQCSTRCLCPPSLELASSILSVCGIHFLVTFICLLYICCLKIIIRYAAESPSSGRSETTLPPASFWGGQIGKNPMTADHPMTRNKAGG